MHQTMMKKFKKVIPVMMAAVLAFVSVPFTAMADSSKVVTLGANLTEEQKKSMYDYFGTSADKVDTIEVTNADERKYMEGIASEAQIGTRTYSCSYVEPTSSGGIQVKVANLTFVTSSMIASTLLTSGVENCNVVAGSPIEVSGTGALTGIMMAYEKASGEELSEDQKATATEELVTTGELAESIGQQEAADLMNEVKQEVIEDGLKDEDEIEGAVNDAADSQNVSLNEDQKAKIVSLMKSISQYDYDVKALKNTLENLEGKSEGFFSNLWNSIKSFFTGGDSDGGIINNTNDSILGDNAVIDSTIDALKSKDSGDGESFWDKIVNFFKNLFGGDDEDASDNSDKGGTSDDADAPDSSDSSPDAGDEAPEDGTDSPQDDGTGSGSDTQENQDGQGTQGNEGQQDGTSE
ncbi:DUF1002 domain-containing protein [Dorea sp. D27]|uniref:DUF1002 domain-containing protein n=1 Tax=Dorea sp. D27 TaxID=658665 RepID=UPI000AD5C493|nr:DUF1002 domain-containing protein [Dorea sp. D27]